LPAEPEIVAEYLAQRAQAGAAVASLNVTLAALRFAHTIAGLTLRLDSPLLTLLMKGIRRQHLRPQRQAEPLTGDLLRQVLGQPRKTTEDLRDGALLAILYVFGLRAAEAVALDWQVAGDGRGWLRVLPDRAEVVLLGSKASPGQTERVVIPTTDNPLAIEAIAGWISYARVTQGEPLLRALTRGGGVAAGQLHAGSIGRIVKCAMARHFQREGLSREVALARAASFSGHSGRVGMCVTATEAGVPHQHLAALVRHTSLAMVRRYAEQADRFKCAPHRTPGVGV
jgi:site-specific recombinase XerC